jgi:nucleotide-binding universal stress UspA family protein
MNGDGHTLSYRTGVIQGTCQEEQARALASSKRALERAYEILKQGGFDDSRITTRFANTQNARVSDVILNEQRSGGYSAIVVGKHHLSRAEEFLFGNVAVRLARQASCPVWLIDETGLQQMKQTEDLSPSP